MIKRNKRWWLFSSLALATIAVSASVIACSNDTTTVSDPNKDTDGADTDRSGNDGTPVTGSDDGSGDDGTGSDGTGSEGTDETGTEGASGTEESGSTETAEIQKTSAVVTSLQAKLETLKADSDDTLATSHYVNDDNNGLANAFGNTLGYVAVLYRFPADTSFSTDNTTVINAWLTSEKLAELHTKAQEAAGDLEIMKATNAFTSAIINTDTDIVISVYFSYEPTIDLSKVTYEIPNVTYDIASTESDWTAFAAQHSVTLKISEDETVKTGDTIILDYSGVVDGEKFTGGTATDQSLTIGSGNFITGFEDALIGRPFNQQFTFELAFPDPYTNNTALSGKTSTWTITIKSLTTTLDKVTDDAEVLNWNADNSSVVSLETFKEYRSNFVSLENLLNLEDNYVSNIYKQSWTTTSQFPTIFYNTVFNYYLNITFSQLYSAYGTSNLNTLISFGILTTTDENNIYYRAQNNAIRTINNTYLQSDLYAKYRIGEPTDDQITETVKILMFYSNLSDADARTQYATNLTEITKTRLLFFKMLETFGSTDLATYQAFYSKITAE